MFKHLTPTILLSSLVLTAAGCADGSATANPAPSAPPTTVPTTGAPATPTSDPPPAPELPTRYVEIDDGAFESIGEMADASDVVVVATVTAEEAIESDRDDVNPSAAEHLGLRLQVDEILKGDPGDEIRLAWFAFELGPDGDPLATNLLNGIPVPGQGDQLVLFLRPITDESQDLLGYATHTPVMLDGVGFVEDDTVTITDDVVPEIAVLSAATLDEIRDAV